MAAILVSQLPFLGQVAKLVLCYEKASKIKKRQSLYTNGLSKHVDHSRIDSHTVAIEMSPC